MGNQLTAPGRSLPPAEVLADLGNVTYKDSLGGGRLFKSALCVHDDGGLVVVKVYTKHGGGAGDPAVATEPYKARLLDIKARLAALPYPHAWPVQRIYESDRAVFLVRQYLHANLAQRVSTRPFLTLIEKRWIAYQLLLAVAQCHEAGLCHGDIKPDNVVLTSWDWAFLTDFSPYKPTLLPADNPADFSSFFHTTGKRKCYLAPERFYDPAPGGITPQQAAAAPLTPAMDVFALGCVLAELFLDGQPLFEYSNLLAYRVSGTGGTAGGANPLGALDKVHHSVRGMIAHMVQRDPAARHSVQQYLQEASSGALPPFLGSTIHPFFASMLQLDTDARVVRVQQEYGEVKRQLLTAQHGDSSSTHGAAASGGAGSSTVAAGQASDASPAGSRRGSLSPDVQRRGADSGEPDSGARERSVRSAGRPPLHQAVGGLLAEAQASLKQLEGRTGGPSRGSSRGGTPQLTPRGSSQTEQQGASGADPGAAAAGQAAGTAQASSVAARQQQGAPPAGLQQQQQQAGVTQAPATPTQQQHEGMVLVAVLLCTLLRGSRLQEHKARVVSLLCDSAAFCDDETRLQRVLPYLVAATAEPLAAVKVVALRAITRVLAQVRSVPPSEAKVFNEYVLPSLSLLPSEAELAVQVEYASCIAQLASTAQAFLEQLQRRRLQHNAAAAAGSSAGGSASSAATSAAGGGGGGGSSGSSAVLLNYDEEMGHLRTGVERVVHDLLVGPHSETKLALLPHLERLAAFAGRRDTADVLLPSLLTFFNSQSWQVRAAFYSAFAGVCLSLGPEGVADIVPPFLDRLVGDSDAAVVAEAVAFLAAICSAGLLRKRHVLQVAERLCCAAVLGPGAPTPVRAAAVDFLAAAGRQLSPADVQARLLPLALPHLASEPLSFQDPQQIARALKDDTQGASSSGGDGARVPRRSRPVQPMRPGYPPVPAAVPPLPPAAVQRFGSGPAAEGRPSLDSLGPLGGTSRKPGSSSVMVGATGGGGAAAGPPPGSHSVLLPPPNASTYSLPVDPRYLHHGSSYLSAALEQSLMAHTGAGGHLVASASSAAQQGQRGAGPRLHMSAHWGPADSGMQLVARARRSAPQPASITQQMRVPLAPAQRGEPGGGVPGAAGGVKGAMSAALAAGLPGGGGEVPSQHVAPWYPRGVLVAHLAEHKKAVNRLAVAGCGTFFASASSDETVKVWDCRRLETDVSFRSRLTYTAQAGRITGLAACQDSQSMASGSSTGSIHVWRVEYAARVGGAPERYTGILSSRQVCPDGSAVLDLAAWGPSLLVYTTQQGGLSAWDVRMGQDAWSLPYSPVQGAVQRVVLDPATHNWLLGGTSRGHLCLWDARFRLPVNTWQHPSGAPVAALALAAAPGQRLGLGLGGAAGGGGAPLLYVAAGEQEVGLWDIAQGRCQQVLRVLRPGAGDAARRQPPAALAPPQAGLLPPRGLDMMARARQLAISELQAPASRRRDGFCALLPTAGGQLLAGGSDRAVRCWDSGRPAHSYVVCAPPPPFPSPQAGSAADAPVDASGAPLSAAEPGSQVSLVDVPSYSYATRSVAGVPVVEESCSLQRSSSATATGSAAEREQHLAKVAWAERAAALCHSLAVTDLARVEAQAGEPLLLSAGADGIVKAWR